MDAWDLNVHVALLKVVQGSHEESSWGGAALKCQPGLVSQTGGIANP